MKKRNNQSGEGVKQTPKFKILDAVIILLIITSVLGIYFRFNLLDTLTNKRDIRDYTVAFSIQDIRYTTEKYIHVGDVIYDSATGDRLGILTTASDAMADIALSVSPANKYFTMKDGTVEVIPYPNESRIDATGRMICSGSYTKESGFLVNGSTHLSPGQSVAVRTELVTFVLKIEEIAVIP